MGADTKIEWTDATWNPVRGCSRVSEGCRRCYAEKVAARFSGRGQAYEGLAHRVGGEARWTGKIRIVGSAMYQPLRWRTPRRIFVNSMSDLFHERLIDEDIDQIFALMALAPHHTFQVLTKRAERMRLYSSREGMARRIWDLADEIACDHHLSAASPAEPYLVKGPAHAPWPLPNVWLGVSVEDQAAADERIPHLLQTPAAIRFLSLEPLLGPVNIRGHALGFEAGQPATCQCGHGHGFTRCPNTGSVAKTCHRCDCKEFRRATGVGLHWAIVGGESGQGDVRPMHPDWARSLRDQCQAAGVPFFFKQFGEYLPRFPQYASEYGVEEGDMMCAGKDFPAEGVLYRDGYFYDGVEHQPHTDSGAYWIERVGKKAAGRLLDGRTWDEFPKVAA